MWISWQEIILLPPDRSVYDKHTKENSMKPLTGKTTGKAQEKIKGKEKGMKTAIKMCS